MGIILQLFGKCDKLNDQGIENLFRELLKEFKYD